MNTYTATEIVAVLTAEGHGIEDINAAITSLIDAWVDQEQGDSAEWIYNDNDLDVLRDQLAN
jgi:hypothetical protein